MRLLPLCALVAAACASPPSSVQRSAIIGGTRDTGDPAIVLLVSYAPGGTTLFTCTASVIAPSVLVTAAHCVDAAHHPGHTFGVYLGDDASAYSGPSDIAGALHLAASVHAHPSYNPAAPFVADIGVVVLVDPLSITPLPIARSPLAATLPGQPARIVGYGQTTYNVYNATKYAATTTVASLPPDDTVVVGDATRHTCVGDSGSPALAQLGGAETIIGVDSYTDTTGCTEAAHYRRIDKYLPFIDTYLPTPALDLGVDAAMADLTSAATTSADAAVAGDMGSGCSLSPRGPVTGLGCVALLALARRRRRSSGQRSIACSSLSVSRVVCRTASTPSIRSSS